VNAELVDANVGTSTSQHLLKSKDRLNESMTREQIQNINRSRARALDHF
jgi:hypothetical protein